MQRERVGRNDLFDMVDPFGFFRGFGFQRSMMPSLFGGRDPFDDPFFTHPFRSMFESSMFRPSAPIDPLQSCEGKGLVIEELNSDDEGGKNFDIAIEGREDNCQKQSGSSNVPSVEHPDDDTDAVGGQSERKSKIVGHGNNHYRPEGTKTQARSFSVQSCKVTYGGVDGAYYTSTRTRRMGNDGVALEESKEADRTTRQATHRISRGIHDKGHSVMRKLNSDGKVDTTQTLHNLSKDELAGFEEAWKGNVGERMPGWSAGSSSGEQKGMTSWGGCVLPSTEQAHNARGMGSNNEARTNPSDNRAKKVVRINIE